MRITALSISPFERTLVVPFVSSQGSLHLRRGFIVRIADEAGHSGRGEASALDGFSPDSRPTTELALAQAGRNLADRDIPDSRDDIAALVDDLIPSSCPAARFGRETALYDLSSRRAGKPLSIWLNPQAGSHVQVNYLFIRPVDDWEKVKSEIARSGYHTVKIKVGGQVDDDIAFVKLARLQLGEKIRIRLDANRGWSRREAETALHSLAAVGIAFIEEPYRWSEITDIRRLGRSTGIRMALDESLIAPSDPQSFIAGEAADLFILKPTLLGGIRQTWQLAETARAHGCRVVVTSTLESETGIAALLHLAAALPGEPEAAGLDTLRLLADADPHLTTVIDGAVAVPKGPGLGIGDSQ